MADSTKSLEADQQPPEKDRSAALENSSGEQYQVTAIIKRVPDEVHTADGERRAKEEAYWERQVYWQRITAWATIFAFVAAAIYADIARRQWGTIQGQLTAMQEANQIARDALALGERLWVGLSGVQPVGFAVGGDTGVQLYFFNSGRTPALRGEHETYIDLTHEQPVGPPETATAIPTKGGVVLFPQQPAQHVGVTLHNALTSQQLSDMGSGELWLRFWGIVTYHDREGRPHHTWFCGYVDARAPGWQPKTCPHGNDAD